MKKLYFLNEEEKSRILKLHKKRQFGFNYLNEQERIKGVSEIETDRLGKLNNVNTSLKNYCANKKGRVDQGALTTFKNATKGSGWMGYNTYGGVKAYLQNLSPNDFCATYNEYTRTVGANLYEKFNEYITSSDSEIEIADIIIAKFGGDASGLNFKGKTTDDELDYDDIEDIDDLENRNSDDDIFRPGPKEQGKLVPGPKDPTWKKKVLRIYKKYPCFKGKVEMTEAINVFRIQNPSMLDGVIELSQGRRIKTKINTPLDLNVSDETYQSEKDYMNNIVPSGKFSCSVNGKYIELTPTEGTVEGTGIADRFKCLKAFGVQQDEGDPTMATMREGDRLKHPQLSGYPSGDIFFNIDGTFLTYDDDLKGSTESGTFICGGKMKNRLKVTSYHGADYSTIPITPTPPKTDDQTKKTDDQTKKSEDDTKKVTPTPRSGMGVVNNDAKPLVAEILKCANIVGSVLTQGNLNLLYQYIKNNKK